MMLNNFIGMYTKPFGIYHKVNSLNDKTIANIETDVYKNNIISSLDSFEYLFERQINLFLIEKKILSQLRRENRISFLDIFLIRLLRSLYYIYDFISIAILLLNKKYFLSIKETGNNNLDYLFITYTNNHIRQRYFDDIKNHRIIDFLIQNNRRSSYPTIINSAGISLKIYFHLLKIKIKYPYIKGEQISIVIFGQLLFDEYFKKRSRDLNYHILVQENTTPINKALVGKAEKYQLRSSTYFTSSFLPTKKSKNIYTDDCIVPFDLPNMNFVFPLKKKNIVSLEGDPFLEHINNRSATLKNIGFIPDIDSRFHKTKRKLTEIIFNALSLNVNKRVIIKPHPQIIKSKLEKRYYQSKIINYDNFILSKMIEINHFLSDISLLITNSTTTVVSQALLSGIPVIVVEDENRALNISIRQYTGDNLVICKTVDEIKKAIIKFENISIDDIKNNRILFLEYFSIPNNDTITIEDFLGAIKLESI